MQPLTIFFLPTNPLNKVIGGPRSIIRKPRSAESPTTPSIEFRGTITYKKLETIPIVISVPNRRNRIKNALLKL